jgi:hypothetical protein
MMNCPRNSACSIDDQECASRAYLYSPLDAEGGRGFILAMRVR